MTFFLPIAMHFLSKLVLLSLFSLLLLAQIKAQDCTLLYGVEVVNDTAFNIIEIDPTTGNITVVNNVTSTSPISVLPQTMAVDADNQIIYYVQALQSGSNTFYSLQGVSSLTGNPVSNANLGSGSQPPFLGGMQYDCENDRVVGIQLVAS